MEMRNGQRKPLPLQQLHIHDPFWDRYAALVTGQILPYQYQVLQDLLPDTPPSHCIRNLRIAAGEEQGRFQGWVFQDTDLAKWLEAVAYALTYAPNPALEAIADELIGLIGRAQQKNGYLNSYFTILHPGKQYCNLKEGHELYTAGHFIEAAVAYYRATGKRTFLEMMCRCADHICQLFHTPAYADAVPGHEEIELALMKLAEATGREEYAAMARDFVDRRGCSDYLSREHTLSRFVDVWFDRNPYVPEYGQAHKPVRQQSSAQGHAVRALYLYCGMADVARKFEDQPLLEACIRLYDNIVQKRMYITGGVGSSGTLERFTADYDLPNDTAYAESCASIALALFCRRLAAITGEAKYMDTAELALMNTVLAGVALDGKSFFYVNPLEVVPRFCMAATDKNHVKPRRQSWFGCACCPPNIARTLASLGEYVISGDGTQAWLELPVSGSYELELEGKQEKLTVQSGLPYEGRVHLKLTGGRLHLRLPEYAQRPRLLQAGKEVPIRTDRGYIPLGPGCWDLYFEMPAQVIYGNPGLSADNGKCAIKKGPLVYCLEEEDNGEDLSALVLDPTAALQEQFRPELLGGTLQITAAGWRLDRADFGPALYDSRPPHYKPCRLHFVPYFCWGNRSPGEMAVWVRYRM